MIEFFINPNKAHRHDNISIHMLKPYDLSIYKLLVMIFHQCFKTGVLQSQWEKCNTFSIHKKGEKQTLKQANYQPVPLLPILKGNY